jgi:peptidyl-prolyl cis-trans isomerase SurA
MAQVTPVDLGGEVIALLVAWLGCGAAVVPAETEVPTPRVEGEVVPPPVKPAPVRAPKYAATTVLVAWKGAVGAPDRVTRSQADAKKLADDLHDRASKGEDLATLAKQYSDAPSGPRGGSVGVYLTGTMVPSFEDAVAGVEPGQIGPVAESPFGYHVVRRDPVVEERVAHILVAWSGTPRSEVSRTKDAAKAIAEKALARVQAGEEFGKVAADLSDDEATKARGGDLGVLTPGQMVPAFDDAAFALKVGETSGLVETIYGWHIVRRLE